MGINARARPEYIACAVRAANITFDTNTLTDRIGDNIHDFGQIATDFPLNINGSDKKIKVLARDTPKQS